ncbi:hypothetical protein [Parvicella tangerina]|uniref:Uncharacterized protein n=1 Tax=Parvicella tangerina TaxID=2829795 RepID=A0A916JPQ2_9FLAO|nr:hypothetical protein [Parvicella tangerina]CAG5083272.1 hypothetical protein CRYO30217_02145 [Parvicella tangerina]
MSHKHEYTAWIVKINESSYMGAILEVAGATSFASSKELLMERLMDAANCILESNKLENAEDLRVQFEKFGLEREKMSIPCV